MRLGPGPDRRSRSRCRTGARRASGWWGWSGRSTTAVGAGRRELGLVLAGAALLVVALAAPAAVALERFVLGPAVSRLGEGYVSLPLATGAGDTALVVLGLGALALGAAALATARLAR